MKQKHEQGRTTARLVHYGAVLIVLLAILGVGIFMSNRLSQLQAQTDPITNFDDCAKAGYSVGKSHPRQCWTADGRHFVEVLSGREYYGSSTFGACQTNNNCTTSGCNSEICQSKAEEPVVSICILPDKPTPKELGYGCICVNQACQWSR